MNWKNKSWHHIYSYKDKKTGHRVVSLAVRNRDAVLLGYGGPECGDICYFIAEGYNTDHADGLSTVEGDCETSDPLYLSLLATGLKKVSKQNELFVKSI